MVSAVVGARLRASWDGFFSAGDMAARRAAALLTQRLVRPACVTASSAYNPAPLAAALAARSYRLVDARVLLDRFPSCPRACPLAALQLAKRSCSAVHMRFLDHTGGRYAASNQFCIRCSALPLPSDPSEHLQPAFSNAAAVLHGINDLRYEEAPPLPDTVAPGAVRVAIKAVGICRSDVHYLQKVGRLLDSWILQLSKAVICTC